MAFKIPRSFDMMMHSSLSSVGEKERKKEVEVKVEDVMSGLIGADGRKQQERAHLIRPIRTN